MSGGAPVQDLFGLAKQVCAGQISKSKLGIAHPNMTALIFQSTVEEYDLRTAIRRGQRDTWRARRYRDEMSVDKLAFFWLGNRDDSIRGIYAWGRIVSAPYIRPQWREHGVDVVYDAILNTPLLAKHLRAKTELADLLIFRAAQGTNFVLSDREAKTIAKLIQARGERAPALGLQ
jgi:hypothetical protein